MSGANRRWTRAVVLAGSVAVSFALGGVAQQPAAQAATALAGDQPADPGAVAHDLTADLHSRSIRVVIRKVADWQLARAQAQPATRTWDAGMADIGLVAASHTLGDAKLSRFVSDVGDHFQWRIEHTLEPANNYALAQAFIDVAGGDKRTLAAIRLRLDGDLQDPFDPDHPLWLTADDLFFEAPAAAQLSLVYDDPTYAAFVNREWHRTEKLLLNPQKHLVASSPAAIEQREKNSQPHLTARANGMMLSGLVRVIAALPSDDPLRPFYILRLQEMATALAAAQGSDGLWRPGLLDAASYPQPDVAGSTLIVYALSWGVNHHQLEAHAYLPVIEHAWQGMVSHVYQDGRVGAIPPLADDSGIYPAGSSYNYGVGAFLLAAGEVDAVSQRRHW